MHSHRQVTKEAASGDIVATAASSRPGTQESGPSTWLHENGEGGGGRRSPGLLRIDTHSNLHKRSFDDALDTFRSELKNGLASPTFSHNHLNGHTPNSLTNSRREWQHLESARSSQHQGRRSVFDAELEVDIATMAAQRDQLRGTRNVRGMMAPVISKEEESRNRSATRKLQIPRHRSDSTLDHHSTYETHQDIDLALREQEDANQGDVLGNLVVGRRTGGRGMLGGLSGVGMRPRGDYLDINARGDIMAQSMRRQSLRGSKQSLLEGLEMNGSSRASGDGASPEERLEFRGGDGGEQGYGDSRRKSVPKFIPNSHEDIQILNLQGFMDMNNYDVGGGGGGSRRRHKKKRVRRCSDSGGVLDRAREAYKFNTKPPRRKRSHKSYSSDDDGEMVLRDVDEIDTKVAGLVLGPEKIVGKEPVGHPITLEEAGALRSLLTGSPGQSLPTEWLAQNFIQNSNPNLSYGLIQKKARPCGVLACVQAYLIKVLVFGSTVIQVPIPVSPLRPSQREWQWALSAALTEILWKAGQGQKAILATPGPFPSFTETGTGQWTRDGLTENLIIGEYATPGLLQEAMTRLLPALTSESGPGCVILLYSLILTRGITNIHTDMDPGGGHLINAHGYSSQEIVNLFLVGRAATNTFDGERTIGSDHSADTMVLKGITTRAEIGMLSLFEHYDCYKVGSYLKTPQYPVWVVCCESHYSCLFSRDTTATSDTPASHSFDVYYYDGLAMQEDEIRLTIDLDEDKGDPPIVPPLENCIRTKWKDVAINWNGTDPIL
ncbi:hypothetical protein Pmani_032645 [Petrolisthes manimaculis]|uniref:Ubiquitin carboxyl-terminal hydrolase MINDY n=1 Tax=Petrolisthes manimaculis TaxID=1843537 RepID=A0AAE1NRF1_9EUCA|nr:hypothetical protein Pmani_032645 [Petrolisthes manimaculis]